MALMAAVVATLCYWPLGVVIASLLATLGVPVDTLVSFGGALNRYAGMVAWWLIFFAPALLYAVLVFPWDQARLSSTTRKVAVGLD
jgi:hypothetical protein